MGIKIDLSKKVIPVQFGAVNLEIRADSQSLLKIKDWADGKGVIFEEKERLVKELDKLDQKNEDNVKEVFDLHREYCKTVCNEIFIGQAFDKLMAEYDDPFTIAEGLLQCIEQLPDEIQKFYDKESKKQTNLINKFKNRRNK